MRPTPFSIEIPDRPVYQPGSGPVMAPITLQPDDSDTGWVIAGTVDFQGTSQYVVTPKDNPAHRRPVVKQQILDWVSPKAYEDFEHEQYKNRIEAERERSSHIVAKSTTIKRRHRTGLGKRRTKAREPFPRYMQLEQPQDNDKGITSGGLSSPEHSSDDLNKDFFSGHVESSKRKHSAGFLHREIPTLKRRGLSDSSSTSLAWKAWTRQPFEPRRKRQVEMAEGETDAEEKARAISTSTFIDLTDLHTVDSPVLLQQMRGSTSPRALMPPKPSASSCLASSMFIPATASPSRVGPKLHWSGSSPPVIGARKLIPAPALAQPKVSLPKEATLLHPSNRGKTRAPVLPPSGLWKLPISEPKSAIPGFASSDSAGSSNVRIQKRKRHSLSPGEDSPTTAEHSEVNSKGKHVEPRPDLTTLGKNSVGSSQFSDSAFSRGRGMLGRTKSLTPKRSRASRSSSSDSSNVLRWPNQYKGPKVAEKQPEDFSSTRMTPNNKEDIDDDDEAEGDEETWDIHGILDDEKRRVNGRLVRHYLCEWVGDWDPTWEPEENVSKDAIKRYQRKRRQNGLGFDGAVDVEFFSENGGHFDGKSLRRLGSHFEQERKTSDSDTLLDVRTQATILSSSEQVPLPPLRPSNTNGNGVLVGAE